MLNLNRVIVLGTLIFSAQQVSALTIDIDYSYDNNNFFDTQLKRNVLDAAASYFESRITDNLGAISSGGSNQFNVSFFDPSSGSSTSINDFSVAEDTLVVFAGGRDIAGSTIGEGGFGGYFGSGTEAFFDAAISRNQGDGSINSVQGSTAFDFATWGGSISFDSSTSWYFDPDVSTVEAFSGNDFFSVALHEIAHLLGLGSADSWDNLISGGLFTGTESSDVNGGDVVLASTGAHWAEGTLSLVDGISQEAAMDPTIVTGTRKYFTTLDEAALTDIGWEVTAVPVPPAVYLFASALLGMSRFRKAKLA